MGQSPNPDWMNQWQGLTRQYVNAWQELSRNAAGAQAPSAAPPWHEGFEQWSRLFTSGGGAQGETIERVIDSAKSYAAFMQSVLASMAGGGGAQPAWSDVFRPAFGIPGADAAPFDNPLLRALREMPGQGGNGFAQMLGALNTLRGAPGSATGDLGELKAWLNLPAFGVLREHQEHYQKMAVAWVDYQEQMGRYNALMLKAGQRGFELFQGKLSECEQPGRQVDSLRALYDLWVDAAEEGYAEIALSTDFRDVYGELVNAQMRLRSQIQQEVERVAVDLGMPTRSELNSIGERLQALRREVRERGHGANDGLAGEVASLRKEFAAFKAAAQGARSAAPRTVAPDVAAPEKKPAAVHPPRARKARGVAAPVRVPATRKKPKAATTRKAPRAVAAVASGNFASRIAKFANASLGTSRLRSKKKQAKANKSKKKR